MIWVILSLTAKRSKKFCNFEDANNAFYEETNKGIL